MAVQQGIRNFRDEIAGRHLNVGTSHAPRPGNEIRTAIATGPSGLQHAARDWTDNRRHQIR